MKQFSHLVLGLALLAPSVSFALPILSESEDGSGRLATILPDHEDSKKRYFFPNVGGPMLNSRGEPRFGMSYWDAGSTHGGGGYMSGIFNLAIGDELRAAIQESKAKGFKMSVLPVQKSFISFMENEDGERVMEEIFKEVSLPPFSGRAEDSIGLSASLTDIGGKMLATQLLGAGMAGELNYCYTVTGVTPVFQAKIHLEFDKVYTHFVTASSGRWGWFKWSVRREVEKLVSDKKIVITITGGDAKQQDYITEVTDRLIKEFFVEQTENRRVGGKSSYFKVGYIRIEERRDLDYELTQRKIVDRDYCVALGMDDIKNYPHLVNKVQ